MNDNKPHVLVIDDEPAVIGLVGTILREEGWAVAEAASAEQAIEMLREEAWAFVLCDVQLGGADGFSVLRRFKAELPATKVVLMTGQGTASGAVDATAFGAYDYLLKPFGPDELQLLARALREQLSSHPSRRLGTPHGSAGYQADVALLGRSEPFIKVMKQVGRVAATNLSVLLTGESGTGKEVVASSLHKHSSRAEQAFVAVNCGAISAELIESELFGHVKGSFTGADRDRRGLWEEADKGTVFLDEITETTPAFQVKLLRALQQGEIRRVGSNQTQRVDVRVIAASNRNVEAEVAAGRFRNDLFYRLNAVSIVLPPLRERKEDILLLAKSFAERVYSLSPEVKFSLEALELLEQYTWPGNIRELENAVVRATAICDGTIRVKDLPERVQEFCKSQSANDGQKLESNATEPEEEEWPKLSIIEGRYVAKVLAHTGGNKQAAARLMEVDRKTLDRMIKRHKISRNGAATPLVEPNRVKQLSVM
ncbi:MAG: sigma-54-dependent Fis family transcriptional regulator [Pyrinomonadaceae bacterium]|nr:sigma-54-dependent Fis family transcriptional regulator [Pyrinomonadaceae bacterium]